MVIQLDRFIFFAHFFRCVVSGITLFLGSYSEGFSSSESKRVVVVYNLNDSESKEIAEFYAEKRSIPKGNLIGLATSSAETVTIRDYVDTIHNPLFNELLNRDWITEVKRSGRDQFGRERLSASLVNISYLVTIKGIPLKFEDDLTLLEPEALAKLPKSFQVNKGAVDSELALIAGPANLSMTACVANPLFEGVGVGSPDAKRIVRVSRLDGPSSDSIKRVIERTILAEQTGLRGRAYFDFGGGPHAKGNKWLKEAAEQASAAFFDMQIEQSKRLIDERDRFDAPVIYMGWYRPWAYGPWRDRRWSVPAGAIGFHLHSYSGQSVRDSSKIWLAAFIEKGYSVTFGNVYEPYLDYTHRPQIVLQALFAGKTFGEAISLATPVFSWMGVALGDPLYRPFGRSLSEELEVEGFSEGRGYLYLREANRLRESGQGSAVVDVLKTGFMEEPSLALALATAEAFAEIGKPEQGVEALKIIRFINTFPFDEFVLVSLIADFLAEHGEIELALEVYEKLINQKRIPKNLNILLLKKGSQVALKAGDMDLRSQWDLNAIRLKKP